MAQAIKTRWVWLGVLTALGTGMGLAAAVAVFQFWLFLRLPGSSSREFRHVEIEAGSSTAAIADLLHREGVISDPWKFMLLGRLKGANHRLQAGEYAIFALSTPGEVLDQIVNGRVVLHRITLAEGITLRQVAEIIASSGLDSKENILALAENKDWAHAFGVKGASLEGYLFPETYAFKKSDKGPALLKPMVRQFWAHFPEAWQKRASELGLSVQEVVTLASMVEKEAVVDSERPLIAAVFFNRLKEKMPLQSDPTAVYDLQGFSGPITGAQLKRQSPYNTYQNKGLPIGPICNPGVRSLQAVLYPQKVPYLYFVSNNDGTHQFSETLAEHHAAVARYQQRRKAAPAPDTGSLAPSPGEAGSLERRAIHGH